MDWYRSEVKRRAKDSLKRNYWKCVLVALIIFLLFPSTVGIGGGAQYQSSNSAAAKYEDSMKSTDFTELTDMVSPIDISGYIVAGILIELVCLLILPALQVGGCSFFLENAWISSAGIKQLFHAFRHNCCGQAFL